MNSPEQTIEKYLEFLFSLHNRGVKLGLEKTFEFLKKLGDPHKNLRCFHIAGSNGKGSTSSFIASILTEAGYKTGLYTSPHFIRFNERIRINGQPIPDKYIVQFMQENEEEITNTGLTFFEVTTCMAFKYFRDQEVDFAVIETGLGGTYDSTNVLDPLASIITSISLEHTNILGDSLELIAEAKGGIIKAGRPVFLGLLPGVARGRLMQIAAEKGSKCYFLEEYVNRRGDSIEFYSSELYFDDLTTPLRGNYQQLNASLAILALNKVLRFSDNGKILKGIRNVISNSGIQGRFEKVYNKPAIFLDSAHNVEGIISFLREFVQEKKKHRKNYLLFSSLNDKSTERMLIESSNHFDLIYLFELEGNERAAKIDDLAGLAEKNLIKYQKVTDIKSFIRKFMGAAEDECLVVYGSMYLVAEVKKVFEKKYYSNIV